MTKKKSQGKLIIEHLWKHGSISRTEGEKLYGARFMSKTISRLRKAGCDIETGRSMGKSGETVWFLKK